VVEREGSYHPNFDEVGSARRKAAVPKYFEVNPVLPQPTDTTTSHSLDTAPVLVVASVPAVESGRGWDGRSILHVRGLDAGPRAIVFDHSQ
jgi:hypothetical protein